MCVRLKCVFGSAKNRPVFDLSVRSTIGLDILRKPVILTCRPPLGVGGSPSDLMIFRRFWDFLKIFNENVNLGKYRKILGFKSAAGAKITSLGAFLLKILTPNIQFRRLRRANNNNILY